jgi:hypothetical protein
MVDLDDEPTRRRNEPPDPTAAIIARLHGELCQLDRARLARLVEAWYACSLNGRVLIESVAFEFAHPSRDT